jgi:flagellar biosynthesis/type III secretory pathway protein FliH
MTKVWRKSSGYCEFQCELSTRGNKINDRIAQMVEALTNEIVKENEDIHSACVKKLIGDILKIHGDVIHIELIEDYKEYKANNKSNQKYADNV